MNKNNAALRARVESLAPWFHNIELDGIATAPDHFLHDYPANKFSTFADVLPSNLQGKSVLDIGCNAGFYSLEMKRRGASRVVAIDSDPRYLAQAELVAEVYDADIEFRQMSVYDVAGLGERFDLVLFMGVLYHLRHPLLALDLIREHVVKDLMLFQSMQRGSTDIAEVASDYDFSVAAHFDTAGYPILHFVERNYAGDPSNWWIPNAACTQAMLRSSGFRIAAHPEDEVYLCQVAERPWGAEPVYPRPGATA
ncbi:MAG TPA: TIGR04290 family methyltransferase [Rhizorhapis sp.]